MNLPQGSEEIPGGSETVLLVEDEELLLELVQSLLVSKGYTVLTARDGVAAVEMFKQHAERIALVLTDLGLPKLDGWQACRQMLAIKPELGVIVATGYLDAEERDGMALDGVQAFVHKPYLGSEILRQVRKVLDRKRERSM